VGAGETGARERGLGGDEEASGAGKDTCHTRLQGEEKRFPVEYEVHWETPQDYLDSPIRNTTLLRTTIESLEELPSGIRPLRIDQNEP
jgi:hypothetical protein